MNDERRSAPRIPTTTPIEVSNSLSGESIGRVGNLSRNGMMLICHQPLNDGALYQLRLRLPNPHGAQADLDIGVHTMWTEHAATGSNQWSGLRIISISSDAAALLDQWLERAAA